MMTIIEFNLLMLVLAMFALAFALFMISTLHRRLHVAVIAIRLFVSGMLLALHFDLLFRFVL